MFTLTTNIFIIAIFIFALAIEFVFGKIFDIGYNTPWLITTLLYIMFIAYQILARTNEYLEKTKVKEILYSIMDAVNGVPLVNKDNKIIIQWDVIFKKLIDKKAYFLYDNIIKIKTKTIDRYVNQYPSLLLNSSMDMIERNHKISTKSIIKGKENTESTEKSEPEISVELQNILYVKYLTSDKVTFANYDSSIYIDVLLNNEFEPQDYEKQGVKPDNRYDGFSMIAYYKNQKYIIVPRTMVFGKRIDKEKWLYRNISRIMQCAENIVAGVQDTGIVVDDLSLKDLLYEYVDEETSKIPEFYFESIEDNKLVFSGLEKGKERAKAYCEMETNHNGFEIKLTKYIMINDDKGEIVDEDKTIAIGNSYQPFITVMEKMPIIANNIKLAILKKDIDDLVIK